MGDTAEALGAVVDEESVKRGESYKRLEVQVGEAFEGIRRAVAEPILQVLADHMEEIKATIDGASAFIRKVLDVLYSSVSGDPFARAASVARDLGGVLLAVGDAALKAIAPLVGPDADLVAGLVRLAADVLVPARRAATPLLTFMAQGLAVVDQVVASVAGAMDAVFARLAASTSSSRPRRTSARAGLRGERAKRSSSRSRRRVRRRLQRHGRDAGEAAHLLAEILLQGVQLTKPILLGALRNPQDDLHGPSPF